MRLRFKTSVVSTELKEMKYRSETLRSWSGDINLLLKLHTKKSTLQNDQIARQIDNLVP